MKTPDIEELLEIIHQKTSEKKLNWSEASSNTFIAKLGDEVLEATRGSSSVRLALRDSDGRVLDSTYAEFLSGDEEKWLNAIYNMARRQALRIDDTLSSIRTRLENL